MVDRALTRRSFLKLAGLGTLGVVLVPVLGGCDRNVVEPLVVGGGFPFLSRGAGFFVQNGAQADIANWQMPDLDPGSFRLSVDGLVGRPSSFSLDELRALPGAQELHFFKTLQCVFESPLLATATGLTGNALWSGIPVRKLLDACDIQLASAKRVRFHGSDGFGNNLTVARLYDSQPTDLPPVSLVFGMNGAPLAREHGAPLRLIAPETFGFKCVKWLTRIEVTDQDTPFGTYQDHGFFDEGTLAVSSRGLAPLHQQRISAGPYEVSGFALAGAAPVARVELRMDGGAWLGAELVPIEEIAREEGLDLTGVFQSASGFPYPYRGVWLRWRQLRDFSAGSHTLEIRATDATGNTQPESDPVITDGVNEIMRIVVEAV